MAATRTLLLLVAVLPLQLVWMIHPTEALGGNNIFGFFRKRREKFNKMLQEKRVVVKESHSGDALNVVERDVKQTTTTTSGLNRDGQRSGGGGYQLKK